MTEGLVIAGRYRLLSKLGQGGMGAVWRAEHLTLGTQVAIKLIDSSIANSDEALARFRREAQAAAELRSVHVVHILDYGVEEDRPYIAMELLEGESLARRLQRLKKLAPSDVANLLTQVGRALTRAHQRNIIHRDLKPDNIYLVQDGDDEIAKVLDFGIAKKLGLESTSGGVKTQTGAMLGTPYYMSPEQARAQSDIDHRADIWSFGIIAYECLTGLRPFDGQTLASLLVSICTDPLPIPSSVADVPTGFDAWFARAVARDVSVRFQSVSEAVAQLRQVLGVAERSGQLEPLSRAEPTCDARAVTQALGNTGDPSALTIGTAPKKGNRRVVMVAVGAVVLVVLSVLATRMLNVSAPTSANASSTTELIPAASIKNGDLVARSSASTVGSAENVAAIRVSAAESATQPSAISTPAVLTSAPVQQQPLGIASKKAIGPVKPNSNTVAAKPIASAQVAPQPTKRDYDRSVGF